MIGFETLITITISLLVGYISIMVALYRPNDTQEDNVKSKNKKIRIVISVLFLLFLILAVLLHFFDNTTASHVIKTYIIQPIYQCIYWSTPISGQAFSWENFVPCYCVGLGILCVPAIYIVIRYLNPNKSICLRILDMFLSVFLIVTIFSWVEYYLSFSTYNVFIEFSSYHYLIANICSSTFASIVVNLIVYAILDS